MDARALVKNALDLRQLQYSDRKVKELKENLRTARVQLLRSPAGRLVLWDLLERLRVFASVWDERTAMHSWLAGRQDFGYELIADLKAADEEAYDLMEREARNRLRRLNAETDAVQHGRGDDQGEQ
jgi:hypothetical protein